MASGDVLVNLLVILGLLPAFVAIFGIVVLLALQLDGAGQSVCSQVVGHKHLCFMCPNPAIYPDKPSVILSDITSAADFSGMSDIFLFVFLSGTSSGGQQAQSAGQLAAEWLCRLR